MTRASFLRSPLLLLAVALIALVALAAALAHNTRPAAADSTNLSAGTTVWSATLTPGDLGSVLPGNYGCHPAVSSALCIPPDQNGVISSELFDYGGSRYQIAHIRSNNIELEFQLGIPIPSGLTLYVDGTAFPIADATITGSGMTATWTANVPDWSSGSSVRLSLVEVQRYEPWCVTRPANFRSSLTPTGLTLFPGNGVLTAAWTNPATDKPDVNYLIRWRRAADGPNAWLNGNGATGDVMAGEPVQSHDITGLADNTAYVVEVRLIFFNGNRDIDTGCLHSGWASSTATTLDTAPGEVWSSTLTVAFSGFGCNNAITGSKCSSTSVLTDDDFEYKGTRYEIFQLANNGFTLSVVFSGSFPGEHSELALYVNEQEAVLGFGDSTSGTLLSWESGLARWSTGDTVQLSIRAAPPSRMTISASGPLREGGPAVNVFFTLDHPAQADTGLQIGGSGNEGSASYTLPDIAPGARTGVMTLSVPDDSHDNNCRPIYFQVLVTPPRGYRADVYGDRHAVRDSGHTVSGTVAFTIVDDDGTADTCTGLVGSATPTTLRLELVKVWGSASYLEAEVHAVLDKPAVNRMTVTVNTDNRSTATRASAFTDINTNSNVDYHVANSRLTIFPQNRKPKYEKTVEGVPGIYDFPVLVGVWSGAGDDETIILTARSDNPGLAATPLTLTVGNLRQRLTQGQQGAVQLDAPGEQQAAGEQSFMETCAPHLPANAVSVAEVTGWRDRHSHDAAHVLRWNRVLEAMGEDTGTGAASLTPDESRANELLFMRSRWSRVTGTLEGIGACLVALVSDAFGVPEGPSLDPPGQNADPPPRSPTEVRLSLSAASVNEDAGAVTLTATLDQPAPDGGVTFGLRAAGGGTATRNADYSMPNTLTVPAGQRAGTASISITDDSDDEADETLRVAAEALVGTAYLAHQVVLVIVDNDEPPPANQAPTVASAIADVAFVSEGGTRTVSLAGVFADADNDALTISAASSNQAVATVSIAADQSGLTVGARSRGTATVTVTASDGNGGTVSDTFSVTVKAAPAVASALADLDLEVGDSQDISLTAAFTDADGDALTFTASSADPDVADALEFHGALTVTAASAGTVTITVTAEDADGNRAEQRFEVEVAEPGASTLPGILGQYDANANGKIDTAEYQQALRDYNADPPGISATDMYEVTMAWVRGMSGSN